MNKLLIQNLPLGGKKVLIRVDYNVPLNKDGSIADDTRIQESVPTLKLALEAGAAVVVISHLGKPQSKQDVRCSLGICAKRLSQLIASPVLFAPDCVGKEVDRMIQGLKGGQLLVLENLRFYPAEEKPSLDPNFAKELAKGFDFFVNDAFGTAHRDHSSITTIVQYFPGRAAMGLLMQKEVWFLDQLIQKVRRPFYVIIGGAKVSSKLATVIALLEQVDGLFIGGGMAMTFLAAQGIDTGGSYVERGELEEVRRFIQMCREKEAALYLPLDLVVADQFRNDATYKTVVLPDPIPTGWIGMDIGALTSEMWGKELLKASTVFWNGPLGVSEFSHFAHGTKAIAKSLAELQGVTTIVGGGDSVAAIQALGFSKKISHLSTGGGASLAYLQYHHLLGIDALSDAENLKK